MYFLTVYQKVGDSILFINIHNCNLLYLNMAIMGASGQGCLLAVSTVLQFILNFLDVTFRQ